MTDQHQYLTFACYLKQRYGGKLKKIALSTPATCPNRDGSISTGGCYYCNNQSFNPVLARHADESIRNQLRSGLGFLDSSGAYLGGIAYFQTYSNTYGPPEQLKQWLSIPLEFEKIKIISIATRPDCIGDEIMEVLDELSRQREIWLEIGLQSSSDSILRLINRGHTVCDFIRICGVLHQRLPHIRLSTHLIFGLPGETMPDVIRAAEIVNQCRLQGVKLHPLAVVRDTVMADWLAEGKISLINLEEYVDRVVAFIRHLDPGIAIERISEDSRELLIAPDWVNRKHQIQKMVDEGLSKREGTDEAPSPMEMV
ncbi:MAG: TIGR01212 family radical SAM protein [Candidatus Delongbacteria bacterium]|nr:TIGR01212 family radical SAM protein [Candidatus Delongbacteria bacterium]